MAGPQVQATHKQRPNTSTYVGLNGSGSGCHTATATSSTGLHALRHMSNDTELIYRGAGTSIGGGGGGGGHRPHIIQQQPLALTNASASALGSGIASIAGRGTGVSDALIVPSATLMRASAQRSVEIIVDAATASTAVASSSGAGSGANMDEATQDENEKSAEDVEHGRRMSRHRRRPLHRRFFNYLRSLFQGSTTQNDSELEDFETPARYRPDSISALSRATRFTEDEIKRIYRGFKAECPTGVVKEDTFKTIYSQFFPQGANPTLYAHYVFNTLDQDHSGLVSFQDFVQGLSVLSRGSTDEKLRWTFSLYDINGDGYITREEMTDIVTAIYELMGRLPDENIEEEKIKTKVDMIFQKMDLNQDGVVTLDEFLEACRNDQTISRSMSVFDTSF